MKHQIWAENSPVISFPGPTNFVFYIAVTWGICVLCHSFYINRFKVSIVRCTTDIAALGLVLEAVCFLSCIWKTNCTLLSTEIAYSAIANSFFGALIQVRPSICHPFRIRRLTLTVSFISFSSFFPKRRATIT